MLAYEEDDIFNPHSLNISTLQSIIHLHRNRNFYYYFRITPLPSSKLIHFNVGFLSPSENSHSLFLYSS